MTLSYLLSGLFSLLLFYLVVVVAIDIVIVLVADDIIVSVVVIVVDQGRVSSDDQDAFLPVKRVYSMNTYS